MATIKQIKANRKNAIKGGVKTKEVSYSFYKGL